MTYAYYQFLEHYGTKGQKWGTRNWQNEDGTYTEAGYERYFGPKKGRIQKNTLPQKQESLKKVAAVDQRPIDKEAAARRRKIIIAAAGAVAIGALGYAAYRKTGKMRDKMKNDMIEGARRQLSTENRDFQRYWDSIDRRQYEDRYLQSVKNRAERINRLDALGIDLQTRKRKIADLHDSHEFSNWLGDSNRRGDLNRQISEARRELNYAKGEGRQRLVRKMNEAKNRAYNRQSGVSTQFDDMIKNYDQQVIRVRQQQLNDLLKRRAVG